MTLILLPYVLSPFYNKRLNRSTGVSIICINKINIVDILLYKGAMGKRTLYIDQIVIPIHNYASSIVRTYGKSYFLQASAGRLLPRQTSSKSQSQKLHLS